VLLDLAVLLPSAEGRRVRFAGGSRTAVDGPFPEAEQLVAGYWIFQVPSMEEAVEWAKRAPFEALSRNYPGEYGTTGEITVAEQVTEIDGRFTWGPPKTEAGHRTVTLPAVAAAALAEHLSTYSPTRPGWAGVHLRRWWLLRRSDFHRRVWRPATRAVGLEGLRFHDLRHTSATLSIAAGASTRELMARMGHSSSAAALRYQHVMAGRDAAIAAALDELIEAASALAERPRYSDRAAVLVVRWAP
jgi:hypothetical protein